MRLGMNNENSITHKRQGFCMENLNTNCGDKKPQGLIPQIKNLVYEIIIHRFVWLLTLRLTL